MAVVAGKIVEIYDCGCLVRLYAVDHGERDDLPEKPITVTELIPCRIHNGKTSDRPRDSRLVRLRGEPESYLNE